VRARSVYFATLTVVAVAGAVAIIVAGLASVLPPSWPTLPGSLPLLRLAAAALLILALIGAARALAIHAERRFTTSWWDPATAYDAPLEWPEVYRLVACDERMDPLGFERGPRWRGWCGWRWRALLYLLGALILWGLILSGLDLAYDPRPRDFMLVPDDRAITPGLATVTGNPTAYLALLAAIVTIIFTYYQLRAKVRADSRQQWIIRARELLGQVVALTDAYRDLSADFRPRDAEEMWNKMNPLRLELELMLNPSEKDHRLLLHLIQRFASRGRNPGTIQDATILRQSIAKALKPDGPKPDRHWDAVTDSTEREELVSDILRESDWNPIINSEGREAQVSYILRLSHVVLKREWERVKHTR
jgi:hypothetical protein